MTLLYRTTVFLLAALVLSTHAGAEDQKIVLIQPAVMSAAARFESFESMTDDLSRHYSLMDLTQQQRAQKDAYLERVSRPDTMERLNFSADQDSCISNLILILNDMARRPWRGFSDPLTAEERQTVVSMVENLAQSGIVYGFSEPTQINPAHLLQYCAVKSGGQSFSPQQVAKVLSEDFGSAFLVYPLPSVTELASNLPAWTLAEVESVYKKGCDYTITVQLGGEFGGETMSLTMVYRLALQEVHYRVLSGELTL
ncbi:MAG TPA: hypothetical protein VN626_11400 [Clostridia bacterium]|nr:hypothetical protein [Clostridia bacterium]